MVLVPSGEFLMGSPEGEGGGDEHPQHKVYLDAYYIYKYEVTHGQFARFVNETGYNAEGKWNYHNKPGMDGLPVGSVTWNDAVAYCTWAHVRLPTEAEWEKAARGSDGRKYPWGNSWNDDMCNWFKGPKLPGMADIGQGRGPLPVGSFPLGASPCGALDMAGNVWEWCNDWYGAAYYGSSASKNPRGPSTGKTHSVRGGSFYNDIPVCFPCADRYMLYPYNRGFIFGFRCASGPASSAHSSQF
jgi:formylglycine-generating enzyme required for sulfatase activity